MPTLLRNSFLSLETQDSIAVIWLDQDGSPLNTISHVLVAAFGEVLEVIEGHAEIKGVVLASKKKDFIAGADLHGFLAMKPGDAAKMGEMGHALLNRIESGKKPFVAAIQGVCVGAGLELGLACRGRVVADDPSPALALPEGKLGRLPGGGGTQRLHRLTGLPAALDMMLTGKNIYARQALSMGLADKLVAPDQLVQTAITDVSQLAAGSKPTRKGPGFLSRWIDRFPLTQSFILRKAREKVVQETKGNYPAPLFILESVATGLRQGFLAGSREEITLFDQLVQSPQAKQLIQLFFSINESRKNPWKELARPVDRIGIAGAGLMGGGIAEISVLNGYEVVQTDERPEATDKVWSKISSLIDKRARQGALSAAEAAEAKTKYTPVGSPAELAHCPLVIEAVFEELNIKQELLRKVEAAAPESAIFASNTSALPIGVIAAASKRPSQVIGMHYFSPAPKMPLLEIVVTDQTADWVKATAVEVGIRQGKSCIVVKDGPGFYTTRILSAYLNEALLMLDEGADPIKLDKSMRLFGFPVGPITLMDEVGLDVGAHVTSGSLKTLMDGRGGKTSDLLPRMVQAGFMGKKNKKGFFQYDPSTGQRVKDTVNMDVFEVIGKMPDSSFSSTTIRHRLSMMMVNEAVWCLHEGIISSPLDGDVGAVLGLGFPPFLGGPFRYLDSLGEKTVANMLQELEAQNGARFKPCPLLQAYAQAGRRFYPSERVQNS